VIVLRYLGFFVLLAFAVSALANADPSAKPVAKVDPLVELSGRLTRLEDQSSNHGLLNLLNQVEALKSEVARLRGSQEELAYRLTQMDKREKEVLADYDARIKALSEHVNRPPPVMAPPAATATVPSEPVPVVPTPAPDPEAETRAYEAAFKLFKDRDHTGAVSAFNAFLQSYPQSPLAGNACYWMGLSHFSLADHKSAVQAQQRLLKEYPKHAKVPDAMLSMARAHIQLGETERARQVLDEVIAKYPNTKSAELAKKILLLFK
jgi:tol-pal system protein YbgF